MLCFAGGNINASGTLAISAGWTNVYAGALGQTNAKFYVWWRRYVGGDVAPTVTPSGCTSGSTGDTWFAQVAAWGGVEQSASAFDANQPTSSSNNASAQNIGAVAGFTPAGAGRCFVVPAVKGDNWTSVATLSGDGLTWAEIQESNSSTGRDGGFVWDYAIDGGTTTLTSKTYTVTGGAAAVGSGIALALVPAAVAGKPTGSMLMGVGL